MALVVDYGDHGSRQRALVGGKNATISELAVTGLPSAPGFAITVDAFATLWDVPGLADDVACLVAAVDPDDVDDVEAISRRLRARVEAGALHPAVADAVASAYARLCTRCAAEQVVVAVRSSALDEDCEAASFAGAYDTFLGLRGAEAVLAGVARCWSSLWTARALCYRARMGRRASPAAMSVGVQRLVAARAAGVAFTLNPLDGDRSQVAIEASWGLGEAIASGAVTPDCYLVDKVVGAVTSRRIAHKPVALQLAAGGAVERVRLADERARAACLTDDEARAIARVATAVERRLGRPQDVEWALDAGTGAVVLLQARPETAWSTRARAPVGVAGSALDSIVATLCAPMHTDALHERDRRRA